MAQDGESQNIFGTIAGKVDSFFQSKFHRIGLFVGSRPGASIAITAIFVLLCMAGFSQQYSESRPDKLWIPQGTTAQEHEKMYTSYFPPASRQESLLLEAKGANGALTKDFLEAAMDLHDGIETVTFQGDHLDNLTTLCVPQPGNGHPCFIVSVLGAWNYDKTRLAADSDPLATLNALGKSEEDLRRMLGEPTFSNGQLVSAKALSLTYFVQYNRVLEGGSYTDERGRGWEAELLEYLGCDEPTCSGSECACSYDSSEFVVYANAQRSIRDAFGSVIQGDVALINAAFLIMIVYMVLNLGGLGHKVRSRCLLALAATLCIVVAGAAGYGLSMWLGFDYTPVHSVLPFVILGIGVDDSFVIMGALDHVDGMLPVPQRIAAAISHAGVSIMVTSLTDFAAFAISVSSALPALSSFCMYAALCVLMLFIFQITLFAALATFDTRRVAANRPDCCFCLPTGCFCCPVKPVEEDAQQDPNQMCCTPAAHPGGRVGAFLEKTYGPLLVRRPVAAVVTLVFAVFCGICCWQTTELSVEDAQRKFIPDDSYLLTTLEKTDFYFGTLGTQVDIMTKGGDYFASQAALVSIQSRLRDLDYIQRSADSFNSWAVAFKQACASGAVPGVALDADGHVAQRAAYYPAVAGWLAGPGARYQKDVKWADPADPQQGIAATRISTEFTPMNKIVGDRLVIDADRSVVVMDGLRDAAASWSDMPGGEAIPYTFNFLSWETFRIIKREMFLSVGLCLAAVFVITLVLIAHPTTAVLVFLCVCMTIVDILGCMNMWGLAIDNVSVIQLVIAVGLCVDYSAHVGHNFMLQTGTLPERVIAMLANVGTAVLNGGVSTFLATMLLVMSKSYVFRVLFQTFFLTVVLGLLHGMVLLPALLSVVGPAAYGGPADKPADTDTKVVAPAALEENKAGA